MSDAYDDEEESGGIAGFFRGLFKSRESEPEEAAPQAAPLGKLSARERLAALQKAKAAAPGRAGAAGHHAGRVQPAAPQGEKNAPPAIERFPSPQDQAPAAPSAAPAPQTARQPDPVPPPPPVPAPPAAPERPAPVPPPPPPSPALAALSQLDARMAALEKAVASVAARLEAGPTLEERSARAAAAAENESLKARVAALEARVLGLPASQEMVLTAEGRMGVIADRLSAMETALNRLSLRSGLHEKITGRDAGLLRGRVDKLEAESATGADVEKQAAAVGELACSFIKLEAEVRDLAKAAGSAGRLDSSLKDLLRRMEDAEQQGVHVRKLESDRDLAEKRLVKLESAAEALTAEQAKAAETSLAEGAAIEELRAKLANISVIFDHIRRPLGDAADRLLASSRRRDTD